MGTGRDTCGTGKIASIPDSAGKKDSPRSGEDFLRVGGTGRDTCGTGIR